MRRCDTCAFWVLGGESPILNEKRHQDDREGYCRRHAPAPFDHGFAVEVLRHLTRLSWNVELAEESETEKNKEFEDWEEAMLKTRAWPTTTASDWCGDWREKI